MIGKRQFLAKQEDFVQNRAAKRASSPAVNRLEQPDNPLAARSLAPDHIIHLQQTIGNRAVMRLIKRNAEADADKAVMKNVQRNEARSPRRSGAQSLLQRIYLWDRQKAENPSWSDDEKAPLDYLPSGKYNDNENGEDDLYVRMKKVDLFYGIAYEENDEFGQFIERLGEFCSEKGLDIENLRGMDLANVLIQYEENYGHPPMLEVEFYQMLYGGSSGWNTYMQFLKEQDKVMWAKIIKEENPDLPWTDDQAGFACQVAMIEALKEAGSVRFLLNGMKDVKGIIEGTAYESNVTSHELKFVVAMLGRQVKTGRDTSITVIDSENVFFYLNRELITAGQLSEIGKTD